MLPDRVSNPGPLTYESGALPIALRGPASHSRKHTWEKVHTCSRCGAHFIKAANLKRHNLIYTRQKMHKFITYLW